MTKTVLLIRNAAPNDFGGAETYPVSLAKLIAQENWTPVIVTGSEKLLAYSKENNIEAIKGKWRKSQNLSGIKTLLFPFYLVWQLYLTFWYIGLINKTGANVLHIQSRDDFIAASIAGHIKKRQVIWTDHMDLRYIFENIAKPLRNPLGKLVYWAARFSNHIILISDNEHRLVTGHFKNKNALNGKIRIIKNGVIDEKAAHPDPQSSPVFNVCIASRIVTNKGIGEAIDGYTEFSNTVPENASALHIYGDGKDLETFKNKARSNASIVFHGHTTNSLGAINNSTVYMLPSYQEGFSIALLEATMLGKPIIASSVDSNSEIIEDGKTGLLVPAKDPHAIAAALAKLYNDSALRRTLGEAARHKYENEFNLEDIVKNKILPLYEQ